MRVRVLLDNQLSWKRVGAPLRRRGHDVLALQQKRALDGLEDEGVLTLAAEQRRILVTRNSKDFVPILSRWARGDRGHAGCILVWSLDHAEHRRIVAAVERLLLEYPHERDWSSVSRAI